MPRLVRRAPLMERLRGHLNPMDLWLWASEELETRDWNSQKVGTQLGIVLSFIFMIARANSEGTTDVDRELFGDGDGTGWAQYLAVTAVWVLTPFSILNAVLVFTRTRQYRLFEANVEQAQHTPSARRVRVQSTPASASSPIRLISTALSGESAEERAHPDSSRDVWELSIWDPLPLSLRILCLFSPGHVLVYLMFLPLAQLDQRPSITVASCVLLQVVMSAQMVSLSWRYSQQARDTAIIQREVMNEYDTKFVRPRLHPVVRDVGIQVSIGPGETGSSGGRQDRVEVGTPTTLIKRGFRTNPNPNYKIHVDPDGSPMPSTRPRKFVSSSTQHGYFLSAGSADKSSPAPPAEGHRGTRPTTPASPYYDASSTSAGTGADFGGSMGIYSHARSPLKKAISMNNMTDQVFSPRNSREMAAIEQLRRQTTPVRSTEPRPLTGNPFQAHKGPYERYPSRC